MIGKILIYISFVIALASAGAYFYSLKKENLQKTGRLLYYVMTGLIVITSGYLMVNILNHNFQFTYIWSYSSKELPLHLLISTFYAGQEGSFMLWTLMTVAFGAVLIPYARKKGYESAAMGVMSLIMVFLLLMLIFKSPFMYVWQSFAEQNLEAGFMPGNGRGLNPILENYWMAIHPPILFLGYASMAVPFAFGIAGLIKREYREWIHVALPWILASNFFLGLGISLGGFWSYETLGWGGFWAWDPVENSSFLPWMIAITLLHTLLVQKRTQGLVKTNFILAIIGYVLVLYATFLTRSGILGDTSVHSFVDPGMIVYTLLIVGMLFFLGLGLFIFFMRLKDMKTDRSGFKPSSREFILSLGSAVLLAFTFIVFVGTSWPIFTELFGTQKSSVDISFYNDWALPFGILFMVLNAIALYFNWKQTGWSKILKQVGIAAIPSVLIGVFMYINSVTNFNFLFLAFAAVFSLIINLEFLLKKIIKKPSATGAYISHIGLAIMVFGVIGSGPYSKDTHLSLVQGIPHQALGYTFTFTGKTRVEKELQDREKYEYHVEIAEKGGKSVVSPIFYWSDFNDRRSPFLEPGIHTSMIRDIYVSPNSVETASDLPSIPLRKEEKIRMPFDSSIVMEFVKFDMSGAMNQRNPGSTKLGAQVNYEIGGEKVPDTLWMDIDMQSGRTDPYFKEVPGTNYEIGFLRLIMGRGNLSESQAIFTYREEGEISTGEVREVLNIEVSKKPLINFVWVGIILLLLGYIFSLTKYLKNTNVNIANE